MFMLNGQPLPIDTPFEVDGTHYPANWLRLTTLEEKQAIGITEVPDPEPYDDRFYWGVDNPKQLDDREEVDEQGNPLYEKVLGEVNGQPAMVDSDKRLVTKGLKSQWIAQVKDTAGKMLAQTDWMIIRKMERDVSVPEAVSVFRAAVVAEANRLETDINACADVPALIDVVMAQNWPKGE
jgi:hypothetical protein